MHTAADDDIRSCSVKADGIYWNAIEEGLREAREVRRKRVEHMVEQQDQQRKGVRSAGATARVETAEILRVELQEFHEMVRRQEMAEQDSFESRVKVGLLSRSIGQAELTFFRNRFRHTHNSFHVLQRAEMNEILSAQPTRILALIRSHIVNRRKTRWMAHEQPTEPNVCLMEETLGSLARLTFKNKDKCDAVWPLEDGLRAVLEGMAMYSHWPFVLENGLVLLHNLCVATPPAVERLLRLGALEQVVEVLRSLEKLPNREGQLRDTQQRRLWQQRQARLHMEGEDESGAAQEWQAAGQEADERPTPDEPRPRTNAPSGGVHPETTLDVKYATGLYVSTCRVLAALCSQSRSARSSAVRLGAIPSLCALLQSWPRPQESLLVAAGRAICALLAGVEEHKARLDDGLGGHAVTHFLGVIKCFSTQGSPSIVCRQGAAAVVAQSFDVLRLMLTLNEAETIRRPSGAAVAAAEDAPEGSGGPALPPTPATETSANLNADKKAPHKAATKAQGGRAQDADAHANAGGRLAPAVETASESHLQRKQQQLSRRRSSLIRHEQTVEEQLHGLGRRGVRQMVAAVRFHIHDPVVSVAGCQALFAYLRLSQEASAESREAIFGAAGSILAGRDDRSSLLVARLLLDCIELDMKVAPVVWVSLASLACLHGMDKYALPFVLRAKGGSGMLVRVLRDNLRHPAVLEQACRLIQLVSSTSFECKAALFQMSAVEAINKAMFLHSKHRGVQILGRRAKGVFAGL